MANEIQLDYESGKNLYAVVRNSSGQVWHIINQTFEAWGAGGHDADDYDISLTGDDGDRYVGSFDTNIGAGIYTVAVFERAGASPADSDDVIGSGEIIWTGSVEEHLRDAVVTRLMTDTGVTAVCCE